MGTVRALPRHSNGSSVAAVSSQDSLLGPQALEQRLRSLFDRVAPFTVGAEEELLLIDAETLQPAPAAEYALALGAGDRTAGGRASQRAGRGDDACLRLGRRRRARARLDPPPRRARPRRRTCSSSARAHTR